MRRLTNVQAGLLVVVLAVLGTAAAFTKRNPFADRFELRVAFKSNTTLKKGSPVRIAGVPVGKVSAVEAAEGSESATRVTIEIEDKGLPIHTDATFKARPRVFLEGNDFVDIEPGSPSAPTFGDGDDVPVGQTASATSIADVLDIFQKDGREAFSKVLDEYGRALDGGGAEAANRTFRWTAPAYRDGAIVADASHGERWGDLRRYLDSSATVAAALDKSPPKLQGFVRDLATTAGALASEQRALADAIGELPGTLRTGYRALGSLNEAFPPLRRFVNEMRPAIRSSGPALDAQEPLVRQLRAAVRPSELRGLASDLRDVVPDLVELNEGGVKLQTEARELGSCQLNVIGPWQRDRIDGPFPSTGRVFEEGVKWLPGIAGESRNFDAHAQYVRSQPNGASYAIPQGNGRVMLSGVPLRGVLPAKAPQPAFRPDVPCETQERPDLRAKPGAVPQAIKVDQTSKAADARRAKILDKAIPELRRVLKTGGLDKKYKVSRTPLKASQIKLVGRRP